MASGSVITRDVPPDSLALGRARQEVKPRLGQGARAGTAGGEGSGVRVSDCAVTFHGLHALSVSLLLRNLFSSNVI